PQATSVTAATMVTVKKVSSLVRKLIAVFPRKPAPPRARHPRVSTHPSVAPSNHAPLGSGHNFLKRGQEEPRETPQSARARRRRLAPAFPGQPELRQMSSITRRGPLRDRARRCDGAPAAYPRVSSFPPRPALKFAPQSPHHLN